MNERFWDKENKYVDGVLKQYEHWSLEISFRQHTLGSFIIFCLSDKEKITDLNPEEVLELQSVMSEAQDAVVKRFGADRFNYLQMGNDLNNLHFHGIPRYKNSQEFDGILWEDKTYGHFPEWLHQESDRQVVMNVKDALFEALPTK